MEIERPRLRHAARAQLGGQWCIALAFKSQLDILKSAIDLIGRGHEQRRPDWPRPCSLEHVKGALRVDGKVLARIVEAGRHRDLGGEVEHLRHADHCAVHGAGVAHVTNDGVELGAMVALEPLQVLLDAGPREVVEDAHLAARGQQALGQVGADEAGATGDEGQLFGHQLASMQSVVAAGRLIPSTPGR